MTSTNWDVAQDIGFNIQRKVLEGIGLRFSILLQQMGRSPLLHQETMLSLIC